MCDRGLPDRPGPTCHDRKGERGMDADLAEASATAVRIRLRAQASPCGVPCAGPVWCARSKTRACHMGHAASSLARHCQWRCGSKTVVHAPCSTPAGGGRQSRGHHDGSGPPPHVCRAAGIHHGGRVARRRVVRGIARLRLLLLLCDAHTHGGASRRGLEVYGPPVALVGRAAFGLRLRPREDLRLGVLVVSRGSLEEARPELGRGPGATEQCVVLPQHDLVHPPVHRTLLRACAGVVRLVDGMLEARAVGRDEEHVPLLPRGLDLGLRPRGGLQREVRTPCKRRRVVQATQAVDIRPEDLLLRW
mmetsp:Transcript_99788/g.288131  ORF Transcript_99788/g.288131 Transcript_99788/m.288131 type:complete len:305 (-) Transcript_99788:498-1412(-)